MAQTKIEWADRVWNPVTGCTKISPGCENCYAERMAKRLAGRCGYPKDEPFKVTRHDDKAFIQPLRWRKPSRIFVGSMTDLFHPDVPDRWIDAIFAAMGLTYDAAEVSEDNVITTYRQRHTYMILTKRPERMREYILGLVNSDGETLFQRFYHLAMTMCDMLWGPLYVHMNAAMIVAMWIQNGMPGLWLGVTAENQEIADQRIPILLQTPAAVRFVSCEPLLGPIKIPEYYFSPTQMCDCNVSIKELGEPAFEKSFEHTRCPECGRQYTKVTGVNWIIVGGETGYGARPMHPDWVRNLRDQCLAAGVPFFFKSWGEYCYPEQMPDELYQRIEDKLDLDYCTDPLRVGKKSAGRLLDGVAWDEYPVQK